MKIESGTVFEIKLPFRMGFAYARYIDISKVIGRVWDSSLLKVYDIISSTQLRDISVLKEMDLLFGPAILVGKPSTKKSGWSVVGNFIKQDDLIVPQFKTTHRFPYIVEDESKIDQWFVVNLGKSEELAPYNKLKHLEQPVLQGFDQIEARIVMEALRSAGKDPLDYYPWDEIEDHIKRVYLRMINVPKYSEIPKSIRGKVLD